MFDYQNGKYGYNTDANRGADTFHPFSFTKTVIAQSDSTSSRSFNVKSILPNEYSKLTLSNFFLSQAYIQYDYGEVQIMNGILGSYDATNGILYCNQSTSFGGQYGFYVVYEVSAIY